MEGAAALVAVLIGTAISTGVGVYAAVAQGQASEDAAKFNEQVARNNAAAAEQAAGYEAAQIRRRNLLRLGAQRAAAAKSNIDITAGGSIDDVIFDSAVQGELDAQSAEYAGRVRDVNYQSRAQLSAFEGSQARAAAGIGAASTLLGGITKGFGAYSDWQNRRDKFTVPGRSALYNERGPQ